jgi:ABC-type transporter Mla subunit MlaD
MASNATLNVVMILVAVAVLMQALAMLEIWLTIRKIPGQVEGVRTDLKQRLDPLTQSVTEMVTSSREPVRNIGANLEEISRILRERTGQVDQVVGELVEKSRLQVLRVDQLVSDLVEKVETTSDVVQQNLLAPIQEAAAILKGVRAGLEFLFARRRPSVREATQDEQMFI